MAVASAMRRRTAVYGEWGQSIGSDSFDASYTLFCTIFVAGVLVDGWARNQGFVSSTLFAGWQGILYEGYATIGLFLALYMWRARRQTKSLLNALPVGYRPAFVGVCLFSMASLVNSLGSGGIGLSGASLLVLVGLILMVSAPIRSIWHQRPAGSHLNWIDTGILATGGGLLIAVFAFCAQYGSVEFSNQVISNGDAGTIQRGLYVTQPDVNGLKRYWAYDAGDVSGVAVSGDGKSVAFVSANDLYVMDVASGVSLRILPDGAPKYSPTWLVSGNRIAFVAGEGSTAMIMSVAPDGSDLQRMIDLPVQDGFLAWWAADRLAVETREDGGTALYVIGLPPRGAQREAWVPGYPTGVSWNGRDSLVFGARSTDIGTLYQMGLDDKVPVRMSVGSVFGHALTAQGTLLGVSWQTGKGDIYRFPQNGTAPVNLTQETSVDVQGVSASADGSVVAYTVFKGGWGPLLMRHLWEMLNILFQGALSSGFILGCIRRWRLKPGLLSVVGCISAMLLAFLDGQSTIVLPVFIGMVALEVVVQRQVSALRQYRVVAALSGVICVELLTAVLLWQGVMWSTWVWAGAVGLMGLVGFVIALCGKVFSSEFRKEAVDVVDYYA